MRLVRLIESTDGKLSSLRDGRIIAVNPDKIEGIREFDGYVKIIAGEFYADVPGDFDKIYKMLIGKDGELE